MKDYQEKLKKSRTDMIEDENEKRRTTDKRIRLSGNIVDKVKLPVIPVGSRYVENTESVKKFKASMAYFAPDLILFLGRLFSFIIIYLYFSAPSLVVLTWLILSFILDKKNVFAISAFLFSPVLTVMFVLIYGNRVPVLQDTWLFKHSAVG